MLVIAVAVIVIIIVAAVLLPEPVYIYYFVGLCVCMLPNFPKNYRTELHEIFRDDLSSSKDQSIRFWERSGQRSRS